MKKVIDLKKLINFVNKVYEDITNVKIFQDELEDILGSIDKINLEYNRGKISKEIFDRDGKKFKKDSVKIIQNINKLVISDLSCLKLIEKEITPSKITKITKTKKPSKITKITKTKKPSKIKKKVIKIENKVENKTEETPQLSNNNVGNNDNQQNLS